MALQVVADEPLKTQAELDGAEREAILAADLDRGSPEPTESEQVLLEDLLIAIRRLRREGWAGLPTVTGYSLEVVDRTVTRHLELRV